jgi:hypothetical protein
MVISYESLQTRLDKEESGLVSESLTPWLLNIVSEFKSLQQSISHVQRCQRFLESLYFDDIHRRQSRIPEAHYKTFNWIFDLNQHTDCPQNHLFVDWLRGLESTFWIQGKAGSGKSTLMKFLSNHPDTVKYLREWAQNNYLFVAHFYFWNSGTALQKSEEGLLRSLLFEMLQQRPDLIPGVIDARLQLKKHKADQCYPNPEEQALCVSGGTGTIIARADSPNWTRQELLAVYNFLIHQDLSTKFCFFIDGLDEYHDEDRRDHHDLISTLHLLACSPNIKLCLSSRPWVVFRDTFGANAKWTFRLEDLTRRDIFLYISDKFEQHKQYYRLKSRDPSYADLVQEVVNKAQGVFLWVFLVVRDLLEGLTYNDSISAMRLRLNQFPEDLDPFFQHMVDSIPRIYRKESAETFKIAVAGNGPLLLLVYTWIDDLRDDPSLAVRWRCKNITLSNLAEAQETMQRRLDGRCKGLLEVSRTPSTNLDPFRECKVDFLHRTVRDYFIQHQGAGDFLRENCDTNGRLWEMMCQVVCFGLKCGPRDLLWIRESWDNFYRFAYLAKEEQSHLEIVDTIWKDMESTTDDLVDRLGAKEEVVDLDLVEICTACHYGMTDYVKKMFASRLKQLPLHCSTQGKRSLASRLLPHALIPNPITDVLCSDLVKFILDQGANPNDVTEGTSAFHKIMVALHSKRLVPEQQGIMEVFKSLISHGANLDCVQEDSLQKARAVLRLHFTAAQYAWLMDGKPILQEGAVDQASRTRPNCTPSGLLTSKRSLSHGKHHNMKLALDYHRPRKSLQSLKSLSRHKTMLLKGTRVVKRSSLQRKRNRKRKYSY